MVQHVEAVQSAQYTVFEKIYNICVYFQTRNGKSSIEKNSRGNI